MAETTTAAFVAARLAERQWNQSDLVRASGVDKNTISTFMTGKTRAPSRATLAKIEAALGLTPGTLAAIGEDPHAGPPAATDKTTTPTLREATDEELLAELGYRMIQLRRNAETAHHPNPGSDPGPLVAGGVVPLSAKQRRMLEDAQLVDWAADDRGDPRGE